MTSSMFEAVDASSSWHWLSFLHALFYVPVRPYLDERCNMNVVLYYFRNLCFKGYIDPVRFDSHVFCEVGTVLGSRVARMEKMGNFLFRFFFSFIDMSWRWITLQYWGGFCHTLIWINHGFTCVPHPEPPSHLPPHPILLGHPSAPALSTCLMHQIWAGDLFHNW